MPSERGIAQRAAYQRTYIPAYLIIGVLVTALIMLIRSQEPAMVAANDTHSISVKDICVPNQDSIATAEILEGARRNVPSRVLPGEGFLGFVRLEPIGAGNGLEQNIPPPSDIYALNNADSCDPEIPTSFSPLPGDSCAVVIPADVDYFFSGIERKPKREPVTRPPIVVRNHDPEFPAIYRRMGTLIEGFVTVRVYIDEHGQLMEFRPGLQSGEVLEPSLCYIEAEFVRGVTVHSDLTRSFGTWKVASGTYFAKNLKKVIPGWTFGQALEKGRPVVGTLQISYYFCLDYPDCSEIDLMDVLAELKRKSVVAP
ncbi:MAG: hypothetical protein AB1744_02210 [Candidatus Zixiibacteriota bacterium]